MSEHDDETATAVAPDTAMHDLAMQIRYDLTAAQGKLTELMRQVALLPDSRRAGTAHDRAVHRARLLIEAGEWDHLLPHLLQVELDDLGIAHADRGTLERLWESRTERGFRETDVASDLGPR